MNKIQNDIVKLYSDSLKLYLSLDSSFLSIKLYIIVVNLVHINLLIYCILINFSSLFYYFWED